MTDDALGATQLLALSHEFLIAAGYEQANTAELASGSGRLYEDRYGLVCVSVFRRWADLVRDWPDVFGELVELVSGSVPASDAKVWETYLVMLTPDRVPQDDKAVASSIRYDMRRVRKILGTGDELQQVSDIERVLQPLLPMRQAEIGAMNPQSALDLLPEILNSAELPSSAVAAAVRAFKNGDAIVSALDKWVAQQ